MEAKFQEIVVEVRHCLSPDIFPLDFTHSDARDVCFQMLSSISPSGGLHGAVAMSCMAPLPCPAPGRNIQSQGRGNDDAVAQTTS